MRLEFKRNVKRLHNKGRESKLPFIMKTEQHSSQIAHMNGNVLIWIIETTPRYIWINA